MDNHNFNKTIRRALYREGAVFIILGLAPLLGLVASETAFGISMGGGLLLVGFNYWAARRSMKGNPQQPEWLRSFMLSGFGWGVFLLLATWMESLRSSNNSTIYYPIVMWMGPEVSNHLSMSKQIKAEGRGHSQQASYTAAVFLIGAIIVFAQDHGYIAQNYGNFCDLILIAAGLSIAAEGRLIYPPAADDGSTGGEPEGQ